MAPEVFWYINPADGEVPWEPGHRVTPSLSTLVEQARNLDSLGFDGALTTAREPIALVPGTRDLRFLIPVYPGVTPPALLAEQAQVFDHYSGGRLIYNQVNGADPVLARYGQFTSKEQRYRLSAEYWRQVKRLYADETDAYDGEYLSYGPRYKPAIPGPRQPGGIEVWGTGASPEASSTPPRSSTPTWRSCPPPTSSPDCSHGSVRPPPNGAGPCGSAPWPA